MVKQYFLNNTVQILFALSLGIILDNFVGKVQDTYQSNFQGKLGNVFFGVSQLVFVLAVMLLVNNYVYKDLKSEESLFILSILLSVSINMVNNLYKIVDF